METVYLGDGVYADFDGYQVRLTTGNPANPENIIYLDMGTSSNLQDYLKRLNEQEGF